MPELMHALRRIDLELDELATTAAAAAAAAAAAVETQGSCGSGAMAQRPVALGPLARRFEETGCHRRLLSRMERRIPRRFRRLVDAEDVVQDALADAFRRIATFRASAPGAFWRWISAIARHRLCDLIRSHVRMKRGGELRHGGCGAAGSGSALALRDADDAPDAGAPAPDADALAQEAGESVRAALRDLADDHRRALELTYFDGLAIDEVARRLGRSPTAARALCHRALVKLRRELLLREAEGESGRALRCRPTAA